MIIRNLLEERFKDKIINALNIHLVDKFVCECIKDEVKDISTKDLILLLNDFSKLEGMHKFRDELKEMNGTLKSIEDLMTNINSIKKG
jgi:hypothetical protein